MLFDPTDKFEQFWAVNRRLMERTGDDPYFKFIPFRIFQVMYYNCISNALKSVCF